MNLFEMFFVLRVENSLSPDLSRSTFCMHLKSHCLFTVIFHIKICHDLSYHISVYILFNCITLRIYYLHNFLIFGPISLYHNS